MGALVSGSKVAAKYRVEGLIGQGGMGAVYAAVNEAIGRRVAIKVLLDHGEESGRVRFDREAAASARIAHPNIVDVLDMGRLDDGAPFIVMEHLEGVSLRQLLLKRVPVPAGVASAALVPVLEALWAAHQVGIVHRDLKPANIFVCTSPRATIKLLDFGVSRFLNDAPLTGSGVTLGTPKYMSPEQLLAMPDVGPAADLFSVGAVLYRAVTGVAPIEGRESPVEIISALQQPQAPVRQVMPQLEPTLAALIDELLQRDPGQRPPSAVQVAQRLRACAPLDDDELFRRAAATSRSKQTPISAVALPPVEQPVTRPARVKRAEVVTVAEAPEADADALTAPATLAPVEASSRRPMVAIALVVLLGLVALGWALLRP